MRKPPHKFLLIDIGNTQLKWATASPRGSIRVADSIATKDATSAWVNSLAKKFPDYPTIIASVVPKLTPAFRRAFLNRLTEVTATLPELGLRFHYPKPIEIGADRLAAAVAAHAFKKWPFVIISCGTATAFSVLDAQGRFCGGIIAPGLQTQLTSLVGATAQLPDTTLQAPRSALAKSTQEAIRSGVMLNFQGGVKEIIHQLNRALPGRAKPHLVLTGGNAKYLTASLGLRHTLRPLLVFEGLRIIGNRLCLSKSE
jgi:type III pantothenate kinase